LSLSASSNPMPAPRATLAVGFFAPKKLNKLTSNGDRAVFF
jgi:hypothetical protein